MGGIGKTQIALEYVYTNKSTYNRIYWITAIDQASLVSGYRDIAKSVALKIEPDSDHLEIAKRVLHWLSRDQSWLLVIDNLDNIKVADGLLPENGPQTHTLITTRNPNSAGIPAEGLEVPLLDTDDAIDLLSTLSNIEILPDSSEYKEARQIVTMLDHLPLAIEHAGAYVREAAGDFATFLQDYEQNQRDLHQWVPQGNRQYPHSVATTWSMSFNLVRTNHTQAADLFRLFAFLNPDGILIDFLISGAKAIDNDDLRQLISNRIEMAKALIELEKFSLLRWDRIGKSMMVHRLVQRVVRDEMSNEDLKTFCTMAVDVCGQSFPLEWNNDTRHTCRTYFGQVIGPLLAVNSIRTEKLADIMERVGKFLFYDGKYADSAILLMQVIELRTEIFGADHPSNLTSMVNLAATYWQQGRMTAAGKLHREIFEKRKYILGEDHPDTLTAMNDLAMTYRQEGRITETVELLQEVVNKMKNILGDDHPDTLTAMNDLAVTYRRQGLLTEAARLQEDVLERRKRVIGDDHPVTLINIGNLAWTYWLQGRTAEALILQEEAVNKMKKILGDDHPDTLTNMHNLALTYQQQGRSADAVKLQEEVLEKRKRIIGDDHPATLTSIGNLAYTYWQQGRATEAATLQVEVVKKMKEVLGDDDPETLMNMNNLALTLRQQGQTTDAVSLQEEVFEKRKKILGKNHPDTLKGMSDLAVTYQQQGQTTDAAKLLEEVLENMTKILGEDHPDTLKCVENLTFTYQQQRERTETVKLQEMTSE